MAPEAGKRVKVLVVDDSVMVSRSERHRNHDRDG
jgi:hypothetical protein